MKEEIKMSRTLVVNTAVFQVNLKVEDAEGNLVKTISIPPKNKGMIKEGEKISSVSLQEFDGIIKLIEVPSAEISLPKETTDNKIQEAKAKLPSKKEDSQ